MRHLLVLPLLLLALLPLAGRSEATAVSGSVEGTWDLAGSPYYVVGDVTVAAGRTLAIDAGVAVRFAPSTGVKVDGTLIVSGAAGNPVTFLSNKTLPSTADWNGISVNPGGKLFLDGAELRHAVSAVTADGGTVEASSSYLESNAVGITATQSAVTLTDSVITLTDQYAVSLSASTAMVSDSMLIQNGKGIRAQASTVTVLRSTVTSTGATNIGLLDAAKVDLVETDADETYTFADAGSKLTAAWGVAFRVLDAFDTAVPGAQILLQDAASGTVGSEVTDAAGAAGPFKAVAREFTKAGLVDRNPHRVTATVGLVTATASFTVGPASAALDLRLPADVTPPTILLPGAAAVDEDAAFTLTATATDNDPAFPSGATYAWTYAGGSKFGGVFNHVFGTPGEEAVVLTATDASGNEGVQLIAVTVRDITLPEPSAVIPARAREGGVILLDASATTDNDPLFPAGGDFTWRVSGGGRTETFQGPIAVVEVWPADRLEVTLTVTDAGGNQAVLTRDVAVTSDVPLIAGAAGVAALAGALAYAGTDRGRSGLWLLLLPLYTRLKKDQILDNFTRGEIYGYIKVHPGDCFSDIQRNLELGSGQLMYHLDVLEREGMVRSRPLGSKRVFFVAGTSEKLLELPTIQASILARVSETPGIRVAELAQVLGLTRQLVRYHARALAEDGHVVLRRTGLDLRCYPGKEGAGPAAVGAGR